MKIEETPAVHPQRVPRWPRCPREIAQLRGVLPADLLQHLGVGHAEGYHPVAEEELAQL